MLLRKKLKNGINVIMEKRDLGVVSLSICNKLGAISETSDIKGIAHFIEHLLFTGTKTKTHEDISREIEKRGGVLNAFTGNEVTAFYFKLPSEHIFSGMDILIDMLNNSKIDKEKFEKEKKVILEEIKMYHDVPQYYLEEMLFANLFDKPFGDWILGTKESISSLERDFVAKFYEENYNPSNYYIVVVGNADFDKICDYIEKNFNPKKGTPTKIPIKRINKESIEEREGIDQAHFAIGMHAPSPRDNQYAVLKVLDAYMANGMSSKLFLEIREKRGLAYSIRSGYEFDESYAYYSIYVGTRKDAIGEVKEIILSEFNKVSEMTEKDLKEAKERVIGLRKLSREDSGDVMESLIHWENCVGAEEYYKFEENVRNVTLEQVKSLCKNLISKFSSAAIVPK